MVSKILLGYEEALWPKKLEINHASQILTNDCQIMVLSKLSNHHCKTIIIYKEELFKHVKNTLNFKNTAFLLVDSLVVGADMTRKRILISSW